MGIEMRRGAGGGGRVVRMYFVLREAVFFWCEVGMGSDGVGSGQGRVGFGVVRWRWYIHTHTYPCVRCLAHVSRGCRVM